MAEYILKKQDKINLDINANLKVLFNKWLTKQSINDWNDLRVDDLSNDILSIINGVKNKYE